MTRPVAAIHALHMLKVADAIASRKHQEKGPVGFDMSYFSTKIEANVFASDETMPECETVACMAGWSRIIRTGKVKLFSQADFPWKEEAEAMGLSEKEGYALFYSTHLDALQAVAALVLLSRGWEVPDAVHAVSGTFDDDLML